VPRGTHFVSFLFFMLHFFSFVLPPTSNIEAQRKASPFDIDNSDIIDLFLAHSL
jgi:hypothetical protein